MASLPNFRIADPEDRAIMFESTTLDICGPYLVSCGRRRAQEKRWLCVFTCNIYVGIHIEVLHAMNTESLLLALERFISRRGPVRRLNSDNGTNFRSADRELREAWATLDLGRVREKFSAIQWEFGPALGPHFQGLAESSVKAVKRALRGMLTPGRMNDEVLLTFVVAVERMLNERPAAYVSAHPNDPRPVRPADFMGMGSFQRLLPIDWAKFSMTKTFHLRQSLLPRLHNRRGWQCERGALFEGDIVAVIDTHCGRGMYPLGMAT